MSSDSLEEIRKRSYEATSHYLSSKNVSTKVCLVAAFGVLNNLSRMTPYGDVSANGVDPSCVEAKIFSWADGMSAITGDKELCAALLGSFQRAVETLEQSLKMEK